jgi:nitrite reductase/ring-hydroxylating ferredoxin subunit
MAETDPNHSGVNWFRVACSSEIDEGKAMEVVVQGHIVAIFRDRGALFGLDGMCAHQGGPIAEGTVDHGCVTCPWHGWQYELATGIQTINKRPLQHVYEVQERDGEIFVRLGEVD